MPDAGLEREPRGYCGARRFVASAVGCRRAEETVQPLNSVEDVTARHSKMCASAMRAALPAISAPAFMGWGRCERDDAGAGQADAGDGSEIGVFHETYKRE
jgi:hypothetical protein